MADNVTLPPINFRGGLTTTNPSSSFGGGGGAAGNTRVSSRASVSRSVDDSATRSQGRYNAHESNGYNRGAYSNRTPRPRDRPTGRKKLPSLRSRSTPAPMPSPAPHTAAMDGNMGLQQALDARARYMGSMQSASPRSGADTMLFRSSSEECLICMLKIPHERCQGHRYIRVGGGYRHSYWHVKALMDEIELRKEQERILQQRLEAIHEKQVRAIKTYIRTKSGRLEERVIYLSEEDYQAFIKDGGDGGALAEEILKKYLSVDDAKNLASWDAEEQKAVTTYVRTKSGRRVAKTVYVNKSEYEAMQRGELDAKTLLKKYVKAEDGETFDGWGEAEMKTIKTVVRTKSGRLIEKTILVSKEDYEKLEKARKEGKDPASILFKYMSMDEGATIESWNKPEPKPMKVVKAYVRTKSGKLIEKTILMTEEEYQAFQDSGGDIKQLKKFLHDLGKDDVIEDWEKASTVYEDSDDDENVQTAVPGSRIVGKDGATYEIVVDPLTGKKYKKKINKESDADSGFASLNNKKGRGGRGGRGGLGGRDGSQVENIGRKAGKVNMGVDLDADPAEAKMSKEEKAAYRAGKRREDSDSEYSYRSVVSAGGTRHVKRRRKREDGTYSAEEDYNSEDDVKGKERRQQRRKQRKAKAIKEKQTKFKKGGRMEGSDSDYSYRSVVSAGGTRRVKRRKRLGGGEYGDEESYHSSQDEDGATRRKARRQKRVEKVRAGGRNAGSDSDYSYRSVVSAGGTRHVKRRRRRADGTHSAEEDYDSDKDVAGKERRRARREARHKAFKVGKRNPDSDSDFSYRSVVSAGGTRHVKRRRKRADGTYSREQSYHSGDDEEGAARRRRRRRERKHAGSAHSYYSVESEGGTRHVRRRKKNADGTYADSESYHSGDSDFFDKRKVKQMRKVKHEHGSDSEYSYRSEVSAGGTRRRKRTKRIRDAKGRVIGHGSSEDYTSPSEYETDTDASVDSIYSYVSDGHGGRIKVKRKSGKHKKNGKGGKGGRRGGGPKGDMSDFEDSLLSTDSDDEPDLSKMTAKEKKAYLSAKAKRKAEREKRRKEKYGDKYEEMMEKHEAAKAATKEYKSMVKYGKGSRFGKGGMDERGIGLGHDEWAKGKKGGRGGRSGRRRQTDGNEADDESEYAEDENGVRRRKLKKGMPGVGDDSDYEYFSDGQGGVIKKKKVKSDDEESIYEYARDEKGRILRDADGKPIMTKVGVKKKKKPGDPNDSDDDYDYSRDKHGNIVRLKKGQHLPDSEEPDSDGDYFETLADGTVKLKAGKRKIDINKLTDDDLRKLGIDPTKSKQEIARLLKEKFGDQIKITKGGKKVGLKGLDEMTGYDTDDLANDSDLDESTLKGQKRVRVLMKKGGQAILDHLKNLLEKSQLVDEAFQHPDERDASIDFLNHYRLVEPSKAEVYARAFVVEDDDYDCVVSAKDARLALEAVPSIQQISPKQLEYVLKVLDIDKESNITFRMFAVMTALAERVTAMDQYCKSLIDASNLIDIERKMELYKMIFYCNVAGDRDPNYIRSDSLKIELIAGGLSWDQQDYIMEKMKPNEWREISFIDYLAYIPLFLSMHEKMCVNPFDMSNNKYQPNRVASGSQRQRDMNPLGYPLTRNSQYMLRQQQAMKLHAQAEDLLSGRKIPDAKRAESLELFNKYNKLPQIINQGGLNIQTQPRTMGNKNKRL